MNLSLVLLSDPLAICRLEPDAPIPDWARGEFVSITRTRDELSIVCDARNVPPGVRCESGWRGFRIAGTLDFSMVGVVAELTKPLAEAGISVFVISSFDTDFLLVRETDVDVARELLQAGDFRLES